MIALIYIHGFLSSPQSYKAQQVGAWLRALHPDIRYYCPQLSPYPAEVQRQLETLVESLLPGPIYLLGSSLGGYWSTYLAERYDLPAVLINPSVRPYEMMLNYLQQPLKSYHSDEVYRLSAAHVDEIKAVDTPTIKRPENYWLMVQTADETLDYRQAVEKYSDCKQLVEEGGDHSFQEFERHIPAILEFFEHNKNRDI